MILPDCVPMAGRQVLFVMAARPEYGPHLARRFNPLFTGIGPIEAALHGGMALAALKAAGSMPDHVVCLGSAGSRVCPLGEVFQVRTVSWRDIDASPFGFAKGVTPLVDHPVDGAMSCRAMPMMRSMPTWSTWKPLPSPASARTSACR